MNIYYLLIFLFLFPNNLFADERDYDGHWKIECGNKIFTEIIIKDKIIISEEEYKPKSLNIKKSILSKSPKASFVRFDINKYNTKVNKYVLTINFDSLNTGTSKGIFFEDYHFVNPDLICDGTAKKLTKTEIAELKNNASQDLKEGNNSLLKTKTYSSKDIVKFIKNNERIIIKLARKNGNFLEYEDDNLNYYITIDNDLENIKKEEDPNNLVILYSVGEFKKATQKKNLSRQMPMKISRYSDKSIDTPIGNLMFLENNEVILYSRIYSNKPMKNFIGSSKEFVWCSSRDELINLGAARCSKEFFEIDPNDVDPKTPMNVDGLIFKILSIYSPNNKKFFELDKEIGEEVEFVEINNDKKKIKIKEKIIEKPDEKEKVTVKKERILSSGSGFFVSANGHIITNNHVIETCDFIKYNNENLTLVDTDTIVDLAILKSNNDNNTFLTIKENQVFEGEDIIVLGYPFGKDMSSQAKITKGIISATVGLGNDVTKIQIDAAIQPGNSGGPTLSLDGNVIGVTVATANISAFLESYGFIPQNMNFAVKNLYLKKFLDKNKINYVTDNTNLKLDASEIYKRSLSSLVYIECGSYN